MRFLELFTNVEKVNLTTGHHDADQRSVVCAEALQRTSIHTMFILIRLTVAQNGRQKALRLNVSNLCVESRTQ